MSRRRRGYNRSGCASCACAKRRGVPDRRPVWSAPGRRRERPAKRAALIKDGKYRRILPEWIDEYIQAQIDRQDAA